MTTPFDHTHDIDLEFQTPAIGQYGKTNLQNPVYY